MRLWVGTSGFSYREWKGSFYPPDLSSGGMLAYYARKLAAVEINHTFYRLPKPEVLESWAAQVPEGFRFALKASRRITHFKRLKDVGGETGRLTNLVASLGDRAGAVLYQLPPNFRKDLARLERFLDQLPEPGRAAFEFRHESWRDEDVAGLLAARRAALCLADTEERPAPSPGVSADWGYLRLRKPTYSDDELEEWMSRAKEAGWAEAYVFFKHERAGAGPALAARFLELAGRGAAPGAVETGP
ncbi:MAG: DUF72 domain-containing protein [Gemmatimonadota bacterium]